MKVQSKHLSLYKNSYNKHNNFTFKSRGKPITLEYIVEKRSHLLPSRVLSKAKEILANNKGGVYPSLLEIHKSIYAPLLECKTLDEAKKMFNEFEQIKESVVFERNSRYAKEFKSRTDENFVLKMLQESWGNLKNKDNIAKSFGMTSRSSLDWALKQINFVYFKPNYKTLLYASDEEGNRIIAFKTTTWNQLHPDLMFQRNKHAAQFCKTDEYRNLHSQRMKEYDKSNPQRREKISQVTKEAWLKCSEIKEAMKLFAKNAKPSTRCVIAKKIKGEKLSSAENRIQLTFYKQFWAEHPNLKEVLANAIKSVKNN